MKGAQRQQIEVRLFGTKFTQREIGLTAWQLKPGIFLVTQLLSFNINNGIVMQTFLQHLKNAENKTDFQKMTTLFLYPTK